MKDKLSSFDKIIKIFELDSKYEADRKRIQEKIKKEEEVWREEFVHGSLRHKYITRHFKSVYLNISWDKKELTLNRNKYKTTEWKAFFTLDELMELESKHKISNDFILEPCVVWNRLKENGEVIDIRF